jgi:hypothetical protein
MAEETVWTRLQAHFDKRELRYLPRNVRESSQGQGTAIAIPYVNTAAIATRLDEVLTPGRWKFEWEAVELGQASHSVKGRLSIFVPLSPGEVETGIVREDVGYPNATNDDEPLKGAVSDALKRCALLFGIGREVRGIRPRQRPCKTYTGSDGKARFSAWADERDGSDSATERSQGKPEPTPTQAPSAPPPRQEPSSAAAAPDGGTIGDAYVTLTTDVDWRVWEEQEARAREYGLRPPKMELGVGRVALQAATENLTKSISREHDRQVAAEA